MLRKLTGIGRTFEGRYPSTRVQRWGYSSISSVPVSACHRLPLYFSHSSRKYLHLCNMRTCSVGLYIITVVIFNYIIYNKKIIVKLIIIIIIIII